MNVQSKRNPFLVQIFIFIFFLFKSSLVISNSTSFCLVPAILVVLGIYCLCSIHKFEFILNVSSSFRMIDRKSFFGKASSVPIKGDYILLIFFHISCDFLWAVPSRLTILACFPTSRFCVLKA